MWLSVILPKIDNNNNKDNCSRRPKPNNLSKTTSFLVAWSMMVEAKEDSLGTGWKLSLSFILTAIYLPTLCMVDAQSACISLGHLWMALLWSCIDVFHMPFGQSFICELLSLKVWGFASLGVNAPRKSLVVSCCRQLRHCSLSFVSPSDSAINALSKLREEFS